MYIANDKGGSFQATASYVQKVTFLDLVSWMGHNKSWQLSFDGQLLGHKHGKLSVGTESENYRYFCAKSKRWSNLSIKSCPEATQKIGIESCSLT